MLDKIVITHREKGTIEEFDLTTLKDVVYLASNAILYRFDEFVQEGSLPLSQSQKPSA